MVGLVVGTDAGGLLDQGVSAVRGDDQSRLDRGGSAVCGLHCQRRNVTVQADLPHTCGTSDLDALLALQRAPQRGSDVAVTDGAAKGVQFMFTRAQARETEMSRVRDMDFADRCRARPDIAPGTQRLQNPTRAVAERRGSVIE